MKPSQTDYRRKGVHAARHRTQSTGQSVNGNSPGHVFENGHLCTTCLPNGTQLAVVDERLVVSRRKMIALHAVTLSYSPLDDDDWYPGSRVLTSTTEC